MNQQKISNIPHQILDNYRPLSLWESFYLRVRWRLCPYGLLEPFLPTSGNLLDVGCGYGILANYLVYKRPSRNILGIDSNIKRIQSAQRSVKGRNNLSFHCIPVERLETAQYDAIVITDVLHHIDDINLESLLKIINASLKNGGILAIIDIDRIPLLKFCFTYMIDRLLNPRDQLYYRSVKKMRSLIKKFHLYEKKTIPVHQGLPLSDVMYVYKKGP